MQDTRLMDTEPGGESTQYESIREFTETPAKQTGQLGANMPHTISEMMRIWDPDDSPAAEDEDAEWARRFSGQGGVMGEADKDLKPETQEGDAEAARSRSLQGYGPGSGVGA
ncbi:hypothetical protein BDV26DRAFT_191219 [Aspergillus bertholletiae]|uniref:Uncharacterized protein n=1 Tax=Aspergillus bertholletiae TaxID=1226010 RepID=A0A5N7B9D4_9EURO|nr:hypothetical protein BDV26DRAFT_191219 [Aspergillus bertholletiae]